MSNPYDLTAYPSRPIPGSHPGRLSSNSRLFGLRTASLASARILEIGCATGDNIIPLALHFPEAHFTGFDYSAKQIAAGQKQIAALGLDNVRLVLESIEKWESEPATQTFDYILCHGVFSWVKEELQEKIFSLCAKQLHPDGVAYISYNVYPGWNAVNTLREMMLWATRDIDDPGQKVSKAREVVTNMANGFDDKVFPYEYAQDFKIKVADLSKHDDGYLAHEYLEDENLPVYFYQFVERARSHQLKYLTESSLSDISTVGLPQPFAGQLANNTDIVNLGQHIDFIRNTRFRQSILCHAERIPNRNIRADAIEQFYIQLEATPGKSDLSIDNASRIRQLELKIDDVTVNIDIKNAIICIALLHERRFQPISYQELCRLMVEHSCLHDNQNVRQFLNNEMSLISLVLAGVFTIHSSPGPYVVNVFERPEACRLIRYQLEASQDWVSTGKHKSRRVDVFDSFLLAALDGHHKLEDLCKLVSGAVEKGSISLPGSAEQNTVPDSNPSVNSEEVISAAVTNALQRYAHDGCLVA